MAPKYLSLFGGTVSWRAADWTASDDRVRGGSSQSYLDIVPLTSPLASNPLPSDAKQTQARFHGTLDTKTLGGAGFASQRTTTTDATWNLAAYAGIELVLRPSSSSTTPATAQSITPAPTNAQKRYTFILKDSLLEQDPATGREQATISWEVDFSLPQPPPAAAPADLQAQKPTVLRIPWADFKPTYRGRPKKGAGSLDTAHIRRFSIMMRSFFDTQHGPFDLLVEQIGAFAHDDEEPPTAGWLASVGRCLGWRL